MRRRSTRACCVRAPCRAGCGRLIPHEGNLRWREASLLRRATVVQRASYGVRRQASSARIAQRTRAGARCLWEGDAALEPAACARNTVLIVVGPCPVEGHCADERPFSISACPWCDVPAAVSNAKPAPLVTRRTRAPSPAVFGEEAQHSKLRCVRAGPRLLRSPQTQQQKNSAGERPLFLRVRLWCNVPVRRPMPSQRRLSRGARAPSLAISLGRRSTRACCVRAPCRAGYGRPKPIRRAHRQQKASPFQRASVVRRASCSL